MPLDPVPTLRRLEPIAAALQRLRSLDGRPAVELARLERALRVAMAAELARRGAGPPA